MLISTLAFTCMNGIVKYLAHFDAFQIVFFRSISSLFFTFGFLLKNNIPILGNKRKLLVLRGLVGVTSMALFFMSTKYLPIGTAVSLRYMAPIFAAVFAVLILKETVKPIQWLFFVAAFIGVIILKGFDTTLDSYGLILILVSAIFSGLVYVVISKIGKADHPVVVVNYFMIISTITGGLVAMFNWTTPVGVEWLMLLALGVFGYFGQVYMTKAFQIAATNQVAPLKYLEVIFTVLFGAFIFGEIYTLWSLLGIAMIITALVLNALYKGGK
ncbi:DMT family transporter [Tamlana sp. 2_MG-2023]|uniref:DMT family transporter n=1 Tax=unclassified Tamlana TaxID=2614803 RepID=UPI0026E1C15E|nr:MULTISPECIES: DMT family transporter [unclassified Tamlana]MDO6759471.1 DMT family transporter [Tamlana sp. 2_MG-2023]MDO6790390.1 DMT family transporter [Tamlana sp. 1_MG-2023]